MSLSTVSHSPLCMLNHETLIKMLTDGHCQFREVSGKTGSLVKWWPPPL